MKEKIKPCKLYALEHNGVIRHKDAFGQELKVGDKIIIGSYYGNLYQGIVEGCTSHRIVYRYYNPDLLNGPISQWVSYIDRHKVVKYE